MIPDPKDTIKDWINDAFEKYGLEGNSEQYHRVVEELPEMVDQTTVEEIVKGLFLKKSRT